MFATHTQSIHFVRRHGSQALTLAFVASLLVHVTGAGLLFHHWHPTFPVPSQPLRVALVLEPPKITEGLTQIIENKQQINIAASAAVALRRIAQVAAPDVFAVPSAEPVAPPVAASASEPPVEATVAPKAPAAVSTFGRAESVELPLFNAAYLNNPRPAYPLMARRLGLEGRVSLSVDVSAGGTAEKVAVAQTSGSRLLDDAAIKAVQGWTFVPARRGDTPIAHAIEVPILFQLKN